MVNTNRCISVKELQIYRDYLGVIKGAIKSGGGIGKTASPTRRKKHLQSL